jgi:hypothetical protein
MQNLSSDPSLKQIGTTGEDGSENYELLEQEPGRFGSMKVFLTCPCRMWGPVAVRITDEELKNVGI